MGVFDAQNRHNKVEISELSETWQELLGIQNSAEQSLTEENSSIQDAEPAPESIPLAADPWNQLLNMQGFEVVDMQDIRVKELRTPAYNIEAEVEQVLRMMHENSDNDLY